MYAYIKGKLISTDTDSIVVDNGGIGYLLLTAPQLVSAFGRMGEEVTAYTSIVIRQDAFQIYAFPNQASCKMFELLQTVTGVGPKVAALVLGTFTPDKFALAVLAGDSKALMSVKGLGKKGAERLILELKDKLKASEIGGRFAKSEAVDMSQAQNIQISSMYDECMSAMLVLGYAPLAAKEMIDKSFDPEAGLEDNVRSALRSAMR